MRFLAAFTMLLSINALASSDTARTTEVTTSVPSRPIEREKNHAAGKKNAGGIRLAMPKLAVGDLSVAPKVAGFSSVGIDLKFEL